jgi:hypothetical protein
VAGPSVDLLAQLRPDQVTVHVAGHPFILTASCAAQWIGAIAMDPDDLYGIMPGLIADDDIDTMTALRDTHPDIETRWFWAARAALGRAAGRDWWWAHNLSRKCLGIWPYVNGMLVRQGINARTSTYPDWLDASYSMLWERGDEEERTKLDLELNMKPRGIAVPQSKAATRAMTAAFAAD